MDRAIILHIALLLGLFVTRVQLAGHHTTPDHDKRCEEITVPMCRNIGYNLTSMPNQFHHETQDEAGLEGEWDWVGDLEARKKCLVSKISAISMPLGQMARTRLICWKECSTRCEYSAESITRRLIGRQCFACVPFIIAGAIDLPAWASGARVWLQLAAFICMPHCGSDYSGLDFRCFVQAIAIGWTIY